MCAFLVMYFFSDVCCWFQNMRAHKEPEEVTFEVSSFQQLFEVCLEEVMEYRNRF
jgi:hypothetical protein